MKRLLLVIALLTCFAASAQATITLRAISTPVGGSSGASPLTGVEPTGTVSGDLLIALVEVDGAAITPPAGWSSLFAVTPSAVRYRVDYIIRGGSAPALSWTYTGTVYRELHILGFQTSGGTIRLDSQSTTVSGSSAVSTIDPPATTAVASSSIAFAVAADSTFSGITAPTGYTKRSTNAFDCVLASKALAAAGTEDPSTFGGVGPTTGEWFGATATFTDVAASGCTKKPSLMLLGVGNCGG